MSMPSAHLAVVTNTKTGLLHGAVFRNKPTPSGFTRYLLSVTTTEGYGTSREAAAAINAAFPDLEQLDTTALDPADFPEGGFGFPRGSVITRMRPRGDGDMDGAPDVEVRVEGMPTGIEITVPQFKRLLALGHIAYESGSGSDPGLSYIYDHYVLTTVGRTAHPERIAA